MKRFLAALMCLCLVVCMLPAQVFAADTTELTISFANKAQRTTFTTTQQVWEQNGIVVTNNKASSSTPVGDYAAPARFYAKSDLIIAVPGKLITQIVIDTTGSKYVSPMTGAATAAGATATSKGNIVTITLATPAESITLAAVSAQTRAATMTVTVKDAGEAPVDPPVDPPVEDTTEPSSSETEPSSSETTPSESTPAIDPSEIKELVLTYSTDNRTVGTTTQQVFEENGIVLTNDKASGSDINTSYVPPRFYANSNLTVAVPGGLMTEITILCSGSSYATAMVNAANKVSGLSAVTSGNAAVITLATPAESVTIPISAQVRTGATVTVKAKVSNAPVVPSVPTANAAAYAFKEEYANFAADAVLPTTYLYKEYTFDVAWAIQATNAAGAYIENGALKVVQQETAVTYTLTATISLDADSDTVVYTGGMVGTVFAEEATITFDENKTGRIELNNDKQVWIQNNITFTNDKAEATSNVADHTAPVRLYKNSSITVAYPGMWSIVFDCNTNAYAEALEASVDAAAVQSVARDADKVTVTFKAAADSFTVAALSAATWVDSITVSQVAPHTHSYDEGVVTTEPGCETEGVKTFTCSCGHSYTEPVAATGHSYDEGVVTTEPGCETEGVKTFTCSCGHSYTEPVAATGHSYDEGVVTTEPGCETEGVKTFTCSCGDSYTEPVAATGHSYTETTVPPTVDAEGYVLHTCACGHSYKDSYTAKLEAVASIDGKLYASLEEAIAEADGKTVVIEKDIVLDAAVEIIGITTTLDLNGKTITAKYAADVVEVLYIQDGANVTITGNGTMIGDGSELAADSEAYIGVISATTGATVTIENGTFTSEGCTAIYATTNAVITINGGIYEATTPYAGVNYLLDINEALPAAEQGKIVVCGGQFVDYNPANAANDGKANANKVADGYHAYAADGSFKVHMDAYTAETFAPTFDANGYTTYTCACGHSYTVVSEGTQKIAVATVGDERFETLAAAIAAAEGNTVVLQANIELDAPVVIAAGKTVTLDLNGKSLVYNSTVINEAMISNYGDLTINDSVGTGEIFYNYTGANDPAYFKGNYTISNAGTLTVNGGKIHIANLRAHAKYPINNNSTTGDAVLVINGGHLYNYNTAAIRQFCNSTTYQNSVTINGGVIEGYSAIWVQNPGAYTVNGQLSITGGEIKTTAAAYVNGTAELKDVASKIYFSTEGGAWDAASSVSITGGIINENVYLAANAPASINVEGEAQFNGRVELPVVLTGIEVTALPEKVKYIASVEELDLTGAKLTLTYSNGTTEVIDITEAAGFDNTVAGIQTLTVSYEGFTATFEVEVYEKACDVKITWITGNATAIENKTTVFAVTAANAAAYQWQFSADGESWADFANENAATRRISFKALAQYDNYLFRCRITDASGVSTYTAAMLLDVQVSELGFSQQPEDQKLPLNSTATFTAKMEGGVGNIYYQWYYLKPGAKNWAVTTLSGYNTDTLSVTVYNSRNGYQFKCVMKDSSGAEVESAPATLEVMDKNSNFAEQPADVTIARGEIAVFTATAQNVVEPVKYRWYISKDGGETWFGTSTYSDTLAIEAEAFRNGYMFRCVVTDASGHTAISDSATLTVVR